MHQGHRVAILDARHSRGLDAGCLAAVHDVPALFIASLSQYLPPSAAPPRLIDVLGDTDRALLPAGDSNRFLRVSPES